MYTKDKYGILFVCLGNICRSPAAEGVFRALAEKAGVADGYHVDSAGTYSGHRGDLPDVRMREAALRRGYRLTHRARPVTADDLDMFDMVVAMDDRNYDDLRRLARTPEAAGRVVRMADYFVRTDYDYVPDPYYEGRQGFELVLDMLEEACAGLLESTAGRAGR